MPKSATVTDDGKRPLRQAPRHLDAEPVVAVEDVADAGDEDAGHRPPSGSSSSTSSCSEKEAMARKAVEPEVAAGIVEQGHGDVHAILEIALDRLDHRLLVLQDDVHDVGAALRIEAHTGADRKPAAVDQQRGDPGSRLCRVAQAPVPADIVAGGEIDLRAGRRMAPCSRPNCAGVNASTRSSKARAWVSARGHLALFGLGHRQDAQGQDFVDLGAVEQVAGAFRGDLRVVVENDR